MNYLESLTKELDELDLRANKREERIDFLVNRMNQLINISNDIMAKPDPEKYAMQMIEITFAMLKIREELENLYKQGVQDKARVSAISLLVSYSLN